MSDLLDKELDRLRKEQPSLDERLEDYRQRKREYDESLGRKTKPEKDPAAWRKHTPQRRYGV